MNNIRAHKSTLVKSKALIESEYSLQVRYCVRFPMLGFYAFEENWMHWTTPQVGHNTCRIMWVNANGAYSLILNIGLKTRMKSDPTRFHVRGECDLRQKCKWVMSTPFVNSNNCLVGINFFSHAANVDCHLGICDIFVRFRPTGIPDLFEPNSLSSDADLTHSRRTYFIVTMYSWNSIDDKNQ